MGDAWAASPGTSSHVSSLSPRGKITEFLLLKGLRVEHKELLVGLEMEGKIGVPRKRTINAHPES